MSKTRFPLEPEQREQLKAALLARHGQLYPLLPARAHPWLPRLLTAGGLAVALLASFAAPAEHEVEVGRRITLVSAPGAGRPELEKLSPLLERLGQTREVQVQVKRDPRGAFTLQVDLWGGKLAPGAVEQLRAGIPGLQDASITDTPLRGRARTRLGLLLGSKLLGLSDDPASVAAAKTQLQAELAERGLEGKVDIEVEKGEDGSRKVKVRVEATKTEPQDGPEADGGVKE